MGLEMTGSHVDYLQKDVTMKAIELSETGGPEVMHLRETPTPIRAALKLRIERTYP